MQLKTIILLAAIAALGFLASCDKKNGSTDNTGDLTVSNTTLSGTWVSQSERFIEKIHGTTVFDSTLTASGLVWTFSTNGYLTANGTTKQVGISGTTLTLTDTATHAVTHVLVDTLSVHTMDIELRDSMGVSPNDTTKQFIYRFNR